jgi:hypothetical protein
LANLGLSVLLLFLLSFAVAIGLNSLTLILHELGHYAIAAIIASARLTLFPQMDAFPPILWVTGRVDYMGELGSALVPFYVAPIFSTLPPAILAGWQARRTHTVRAMALRNAFVSGWFILGLYTLFPSFNSSAGPSDGAMALGQIGIQFASTNPLSLLFASYAGWVVFRFGWWVTAVYLASRTFFKSAQLSFILIFSVVTFVLTWILAAYILPFSLQYGLGV